VTKTDTATGTVVTDGLLPKVIVPMLASPVLGFVGGMCVMGLLFAIIRHFRPAAINHLFAKAQLASATYMGWAHGFADGQKTMGIIALACYVATTQKNLDHAPAWLGFLRTPEFKVASWVQWSCAVSMALGTYAGGWRIIRTIGHSLVRLKPVQGFAAETTAASLLLVCGRLGMPVSTTHLITTAIMGVGCAKRFNTLNWTLVERIVWTWTLTLPGTAILAYLLVCASRLFN
jgi:PiT family inorganic phosphate transporter